MKNFYRQKWNFFEKYQGAALRCGLLILPAAYLAYNFLHFFTCHRGNFSCGINDLAVVFPFYAVVTSFFGRLSFSGYLLLYIFSSILYLGIFYHFAGWFEKLYWRFKSRRDFTLKDI